MKVLVMRNGKAVTGTATQQKNGGWIVRCEGTNHYGDTVQEACDSAGKPRRPTCRPTSHSEEAIR